MAERETIPTQRPHLGPAELKSVQDVFDSRWLGLGSVTREFEQRLGLILGAKHVIAVNSGTSALHLALETLSASDQFHPGDEVIVPSFTFAATIQAIINARLAPVFCEIRDTDLNIDPEDIAKRITERTRVIMPVHFGGNACDMDTITSLAKYHHLRVVDDAAHAFGSSFKGKPVGSLADLTCFSFDPIKNITCGEGGAVTTSHSRLAEIMVPMHNLGIDKATWERRQAANERRFSYEISSAGFRYHLPNLNAAIGLSQLEHLSEYKTRKQAICTRYHEQLSAIPNLQLPTFRFPDTFPFFYIIQVLDGRRNQLMLHLKETGIEPGIHYPPNHLHPYFSPYQTSPLPVTERVFDRVLTLPLFYEMTNDQVDYVAENVKRFFSRS